VDWHKWLMWRGDGLPVKHPTFSLVVNNDQQREALQGQGRAALYVDTDLPSSITAEEFLADWLHENGDGQRKIRSRLQHFAGNVRGTDQYWSSVLSSFLATFFYHSYVNDQEANLFHTVSRSEFHDAMVEGHEEAATKILTEDLPFHRAAHNYKQVVTHFFKCILETWIVSYLRPVLGLKNICRSIEFGTTRDSIHAHLLGIIESTAREWVDKLLATYATQVSEAVTKLDDGIHSHYIEEEGHRNPLDKSGRTPAEAMQACIDWCDATPSRKHLIEEYNQAFETAGRTAGESITDVLERKFGLSASHPGQAPQEWVRPGGKADMGYRSSFQGMLSRQDVLASQELRKFKFEREMHLYQRLVNVINTAFSHVCSNYCWKEVKQSVLYDPSLHRADDPTRFQSGNGVEYVIKTKRDCRFGFGCKQRFDPSGESNLTEGMPPRFDPAIEFDRNKMPMFFGRCNHPRVLQQPVAAYHWGCNADMRHCLTNNRTYRRTVLENGQNYASFTNNLMDAGVTGLEQFSGSDCITCYICGYECKGHASSDSWNKTLFDITNEYVTSNRGDTN
jgi:hypothetical protein